MLSASVVSRDNYADKDAEDLAILCFSSIMNLHHARKAVKIMIVLFRLPIANGPP